MADRTALYAIGDHVAFEYMAGDQPYRLEGTVHRVTDTGTYTYEILPDGFYTLTVTASEGQLTPIPLGSGGVQSTLKVKGR